MTKDTIQAARDEARRHLTGDLLPFWLTRCRDDVNGGFITHYDRHGRDTGEDQKSLIAQTRSVYTMSAAHRAGYGGGVCADFARHGVDFLLAKMRDPQHGGFFWTVDRRGNVQSDKKILYGLSFAIYALSEYTLATGDTRGIEQAQATFDLVQRHCADPEHGGYFEMFERDWTRCGPGSGGGDRKTLDVHMHLMEAFTTLYKCTGSADHRRALVEDIEILTRRILHPEYATGIRSSGPTGASRPIKSTSSGAGTGLPRAARSPTPATTHPTDTTSSSRGCGTRSMCSASRRRRSSPSWTAQFDRAVKAGIDDEYGGVYVEGPHDGGPAYDTEKEFWQQAETLVGMLDGCLAFGMNPYWKAYVQVHRFVFDKLVNREVGEWWPLLSRDGNTQIWTHMSHSWKINYHSVRSMIQSIARLETLLAR